MQMNALEKFAFSFNLSEGPDGARLILQRYDEFQEHYHEITVNLDGKKFKVTRAVLYEPIQSEEK